MLSTMTDEQIMAFWEWLGQHETERLLTLLLTKEHLDKYEATPLRKRPKDPKPEPPAQATAAIIGRYLYKDDETGKVWLEPCAQPATI